eukprot:gnl/TRDRNA2_/TRDRNA2_39563_c0_seq2.p1 gnl/TRDRNA2_/TRDRNA2_39563_c0~~gnl/TRDRNA2_/TRDRNA2_39563_c0_seq2.p1  ORF type:complete len:229 (+),score=20.83 gnl/TRDRNA2_/TRDRNA2_39563_c0_seq2:112-798(+)
MQRPGAPSLGRLQESPSGASVGSGPSHGGGMAGGGGLRPSGSGQSFNSSSVTSLLPTAWDTAATGVVVPPLTRTVMSAFGPVNYASPQKPGVSARSAQHMPSNMSPQQQHLRPQVVTSTAPASVNGVGKAQPQLRPQVLPSGRPPVMLVTPDQANVTTEPMQVQVPQPVEQPHGTPVYIIEEVIDFGDPYEEVDNANFLEYCDSGNGHVRVDGGPLKRCLRNPCPRDA